MQKLQFNKLRIRNEESYSYVLNAVSRMQNYYNQLNENHESFNRRSLIELYSCCCCYSVYTSLIDDQNHRYQVGNQIQMRINVHTLDSIHALGLNMISVSMALNYVVDKFHHFCHMNIKIHRYRAPYLFGQWKMLEMKSVMYRFHSHLKMALEPKNKMPKVGKQLTLNLFIFGSN